MRKVNKGTKLVAMLLTLAVMLCSFPCVYAEEAYPEIPAEEVTVQEEYIVPDVTGPEVIAEPVPEVIAEEPVPEIPAEEPVAAEPIPEVIVEEPVPEIPAEESIAVEPIPEVIVEEPVAEVIPVEEPVAAEPIPEVIAEEPVPEIPAEEPIVTEPIPETEPEIIPDEAWDPAVDEADITPEEAAEFDELEDDELFEFDDDDVGSVSAELLEAFNNPDTYAGIEFTGTADIELKEETFAYGDTVTLMAKITGVEVCYRLVWEANDGDDRGWYSIGSGTEYSFVVTPDIIDRGYRVVLYAVD